MGTRGPITEHLGPILQSWTCIPHKNYIKTMIPQMENISNTVHQSMVSKSQPRSAASYKQIETWVLVGNSITLPIFFPLTDFAVHSETEISC